eukprot:1264593-Rhodomonas_salina.3
MLRICEDSRGTDQMRAHAGGDGSDFSNRAVAVQVVCHDSDAMCNIVREVWDHVRPRPSIALDDLKLVHVRVCRSSVGRQPDLIEQDR